MFNTYRVYSELQQTLDDPAARKLAEILGNIYEELVNTVTREDFADLKGAVKELAEAQGRTDSRVEVLNETLVESQKRTDQRFEALNETLAESQKRTDQRFEEMAEAQRQTDQSLKELAEAQKQTEQAVKGLVESQKQTDQSLQELREAQKQTEQTVKELGESQKSLAIAQEKTEASLKRLATEHTKTRQQVGGLSMTVGYRLEDEAFKALPGLLQRDFGISVEERLIRRYVTDNTGMTIEVNIFGKGSRDGDPLTIVGEAKSQLSKKDVDRYIKTRLKKLDGMVPNPFPILVTYMISSPDVEAYARDKGIAIYYSYDF